MSGIILYKSKYGATKQYAEWIAEETGFSCVQIDKANINEVARKDVIILGGGVYASGIACIPFLKKNIGKLKEKKIIVYACGASPFKDSAVETVRQHNFKGDLEGIEFFYCRGTFDMKSMTFADRTLCKMLRNAVGKRNPTEYEIWEQALMSCKEDERGDWVDRSYIEPIVKATMES